MPRLRKTWPLLAALLGSLTCLVVAGCRGRQPAAPEEAAAQPPAPTAANATKPQPPPAGSQGPVAATKAEAREADSKPAVKSGDLVLTKAGAAETKIAARFCGLPVGKVEVMKIEPPKRVPSSAGQKPPLVRQYPQEYSVRYKEEADGGQTTARVRLDMERGVVTYARFWHPDDERDFAREASLTKAELEKAAVSFRSRHADDPALDAKIVRSEPFDDAYYDVEWETVGERGGRPVSRQVLTLFRASARPYSYLLMPDLAYLRKAKISRSQAIERAKASVLRRYEDRDRYPDTWRPQVDALGARLVDRTPWTEPGHPVWQVSLRTDSTEAMARHPRLGLAVSAPVWETRPLVDAVDGKVLRSTS